MDVLERLRRLMYERDWTEYRLAKESGLSQSTISNMFYRNTIPSVATLEIICRAFGITLAQFFADGKFVELTDEQYDFFNRWAALRPEQKRLVDKLITQFNKFLLNEIRFLSHQPHFSSRTITMRPHDRTKCSPLKPTSV